MDYYLSQIPKIQNFFTEFNYMSDYDKIEDELEMLFRKKIKLNEAKTNNSVITPKN